VNNSRIALALGLVAAAVAGCDGGSSGGSPADFAGTWDALSGMLDVQCNPPISGQGRQPFNEFWERFSVSTDGRLILTNVDQTGKSIDGCQFEYLVAGPQAGIKPGQSCSQPDGSKLAYPNDVYTLSADGMFLDEAGTATVDESQSGLGTCSTTFTFHYARL
jgi:hypothetical protein